MRLVRLFAALILAGTLLPAASACAAETLLSALQSAHASNPKLNAERARLRADSERAPQTYAKFLPSVTGDLSAGRNDMNYSTSGTSRYQPSAYGISASATLFDGFKTLNDYRATKADLSANDARLLATEAQILTQATSAYVNVIRDRKIVQMRRESLASLDETLKQIEGRVKAGDISRTNTDQTRARVFEAKADLEQALANLADSEANYELYIGHAPPTLVPPRFAQLFLPRTSQEALAIAGRDNPLILAAERSRRSADHSVDAARGAFLPTVSLEGGYRRGYEENQVVGATVDNASMKLKLGVPLFDGGTNLSRLRQAKETLNQRELEIDDAVTTARKTVMASFEGQRRAALRKQAAESRSAAADAALQGLIIEFNGGQLPFINVLDGRRELINARVSVASAEADEMNAAAQLLGALGRFDAAAIGGLSNGQIVDAVAPRGKSARRASGRKRVKPVERVGLDRTAPLADLVRAPKPEKVQQVDVREAFVDGALEVVPSRSVQASAAVEPAKPAAPKARIAAKAVSPVPARSGPASTDVARAAQKAPVAVRDEQRRGKEQAAQQRDLGPSGNGLTVGEPLRENASTWSTMLSDRPVVSAMR